MGRPKEDKKIISSSVRLKPEVHQKISELTKKSYRSISGCIEKIIDEHLENAKE